MNNDQHKILDLTLYNSLGFWNFDFWLYGHLAQISAILFFWLLQKLYYALACAKGNFSKWFNPTVNLNSLYGVSEELWEIVPTLNELNFSIYSWRNLVCQIVERLYLSSLYLGILQKGLHLKKTEKLVNNKLDDHLKKRFLWFSIQFQIFLINCRFSDSCIW